MSGLLPTESSPSQVPTTTGETEKSTSDEEQLDPSEESAPIAGSPGAPWFTPSDVLEYLYCPRFLFYERVLGIPQHQELRLKVRLGREVHGERLRTNVEYLRKKLGVVRKQIDVHLASDSLRLTGRVDEVLFLANGEAAPLDYKFAEWKGQVYLNQRVQSLLYAAMVRERFSVRVTTGYLVYVRGGNHVEELAFSDKDYLRAEAVLGTMKGIVQSGHYPGPTRSKNRCPDCCYGNICPT